MADLKYERMYYRQGHKVIAGTDEAGRGPLAGPLVVASVVLPKNYTNQLINDSKKLTDLTRRKLFEEIKKVAVAYSIVIIDVEEIDRLNIYQASKTGMERAIAQLSPLPDVVLSDAIPLNTPMLCHHLIHGDELSLSIAAASILAKVTRDDIMIEYDQLYPQYDFKNNKGYGTKKHLKALEEFGVLDIHRKTFEPVKTMLQPTLFDVTLI